MAFSTPESGTEAVAGPRALADPDGMRAPSPVALGSGGDPSQGRRAAEEDENLFVYADTSAKAERAESTARSHA
jgi:hypothetical protein